MQKEKYINKNCHIHGNVKFVLERKVYYRCTKCRSEKVQNRRKKIKQILVEKLGSKYSICGYDSCINALVFHHVNSENKDFGISAKGLTKSLNKCL